MGARANKRDKVLFSRESLQDYNSKSRQLQLLALNYPAQMCALDLRIVTAGYKKIKRRILKMPQIFKGGGVSEHIRGDEIQRFAILHRLKTKLDEDGTKIIPGKLGHIYEHGNGLLGVVVMPDPPRKHYWGFARSLLLAVSCTVIQNGDGEGAATFDPHNQEQAAAAIRSAGVKRKRRISPEQREKQIAQLRAAAGVAL